MSDREKSDYRNSIRESINAVKLLYVRITRNKIDVLGQALNYIKENPNNIKISIPEKVNEAFKNLYSYTNSSNGIFHALLDELLFIF